MKLYAHQQRFIDSNPRKALLVWEGGLGKTVAGCLWLKNQGYLHALVICPKSIKAKWQRDLITWDARAHVFTRDEIKKIDLNRYEAIVIDEAQDFASPLFEKNRSARATIIYQYVRTHPNASILLLTATPVRSTPWNIHTLACYLGVYWDVKKFREKFFYFTDMFGRYHWEKKPGWQKMIRPYIEEIADIVLMKDCVDVPIQHNQTVDILWTKQQEDRIRNLPYSSPMETWVARHKEEQGVPKLKEVKRLCDKYRKVILVCHYRDQIDHYAKELGEDRLVFVLHGGTKDQDKVIEEAKSADDCIFIIQAQMGAGFDADQFSVIIFASMSFRYIDYAQMKFRVKRIHNLHENTFIHLLGGKCDRAVFDAIQAGKDFDPHEYMK